MEPNIPLVTIVHEGMPCDPPVVNGHAFKEFMEGLWAAQMPEDDAQPLLRVTGFKVFGGEQPPASLDAPDTSQGTATTPPPAGEQAGQGQEETTTSAPDDGLPTVEAIEKMSKADAIAYAKEHLDGLELTGKADEVRAQLQAAVAQIRAQATEAGTTTTPPAEGGEQAGQEG